MSVSSPLVSVMSTMGGRDVDGPWLRFPNTSSSSDIKKHMVSPKFTESYGTVPEY